MARYKHIDTSQRVRRRPLLAKFAKNVAELQRVHRAIGDAFDKALLKDSCAAQHTGRSDLPLAPPASGCWTSGIREADPV